MRVFERCRYCSDQLRKGADANRLEQLQSKGPIPLEEWAAGVLLEAVEKDYLPARWAGRQMGILAEEAAWMEKDDLAELPSAAIEH